MVSGSVSMSNSICRSLTICKMCGTGQLLRRFGCDALTSKPASAMRRSMSKRWSSAWCLIIATVLVQGVSMSSCSTCSWLKSAMGVSERTGDGEDIVATDCNVDLRTRRKGDAKTQLHGREMKGIMNGLRTARVKVFKESKVVVKE